MRRRSARPHKLQKLRSELLWLPREHMVALYREQFNAQPSDTPNTMVEAIAPLILAGRIKHPRARYAADVANGS